MTGTQTSCCARCNAQTSKTCQGCADASGCVDGATKTFYCGVQCQKADWQAHKKTCRRLKAHKSLYQAGKVLRILWLAFRTHSNFINVEKVENEGDNITFWGTQGFYADELILKPFAHHLFADGKLKEAVLNYGACAHAYSINYVVRSLLSDICDDLVEVKFAIVNKRYRVTYFLRANASMPYQKCTSTNFSKSKHQSQTADREPTIHHVFRVRLKATKEYFVIDLSNAQFGFFDTVIPWEKYLSERVAVFKTTDPLGTYDWFKWLGRSVETVREFDLKTFTALRLEQLFEAWLSENHLTTAQLIAMSGASFADRCAELEKHLFNGLIQTYKQAEQFCDLAWALRGETNRKAKWNETIELLKKIGLLDRACSADNQRWLQSCGWVFVRHAPPPSTSSSLSTVV